MRGNDVTPDLSSGLVSQDSNIFGKTKMFLFIPKNLKYRTKTFLSEVLFDKAKLFSVSTKTFVIYVNMFS